jgi:eukaryotic-like serine/threonine-protein kinase
VDGQFVGSIHYMSPEQLRNPKRVDCRSDIWALGAIMYKLTAGRHAFNADTVVGCIDAIMNAAPEPLGSLRSDVPAELDRVILRCFEKDCARRFQNVAELAEALLPFASPDAQLVARRIRGVLIGSDAIAADTRFMPLGALSGKPDAPAASSPADAAAIAPDVAADSGAADPDVASPIAVPAFAVPAFAVPAFAGPAFAGPAFAGPAFRRPPKRSSRALLLAAGGSAAVLAIAGVTAWRSLSDQARTPPAVRTVAAPVAEAIRGIAERAAAAEAPALQGDPPGGAASSPTAAGDSSGEPVEAAAAPAKPPAPQGGAVPAAVASTTASKAATASTGVRASTGKGGGTPVAFKAGATPAKTSRTQPKTAIQSLRKRPGS